MKKGILASVFFGFLAFFFHCTHFIINQSFSLPYKYFIVFKGIETFKNDFVSIKGHRPLYVEGEIGFVKRLVGVSGDSIVVKQNRCFVDHKFVGFIRKKTREGRDLRPINFKKVPQGYVFVIGDSWDSYDSRYASFGLVKKEHVQGKAFPLWRISS
jgi:conjugative transfer signal peptidase TraF